MGQYPQSTTPTTSPGLRTIAPWEDGKTGSARPDGCWRRKERTPLMKLRCERDVLAEALATAGRAVASRGTLPVLSGVRLELAGDRLTITGSDLELTVSVHLAVRSEEQTSALQSLMRIADAIYCLQKNNKETTNTLTLHTT